MNLASLFSAAILNHINTFALCSIFSSLPTLSYLFLPLLAGVVSSVWLWRSCLCWLLLKYPICTLTLKLLILEGVRKTSSFNNRSKHSYMSFIFHSKANTWFASCITLLNHRLIINKRKFVIYVFESI